MATSISNVDIFGALASAQSQQLVKQQKSLTDNAASAVSDADKAKMKGKAKEFESFYIYQVLELMKPKTETEFDGGTGEEMFRHNLNEHMAKNITDQGGFGISDMIYKELLTRQEALVSSRNAAAAYSAAGKSN